MKKLLLAFVFLLVLCRLSGQTSSSSAERLEWWKDARFGMFIHWGPVSLKGTEISWSRGTEIPVEEYDNLYKRFNPDHFNADEWVTAAKNAGMKYIVFTSKHHDGFCMWDTRYTTFNIMNSPFGRDVLKELAEACKKQGIALGTYHSTCDWHNPDFPRTSPGGNVIRENPNLDRYAEYLKNQSVEIIHKYGPLLVMWYDVPQEFDSVRGQSVIDYIRTVQPDILVNDRTGARGDYDTPEQRVGSFQNDRPWETCMTIGRQWAWKPNDEVKSLEQCLSSLIRSAGGDGNLLFNVGPGPDGRIEPLQVTRLKEMGDWLNKYGYTIYGTRGGPFLPTDWGVSTRMGNRIYLHILNWCGNSPRIILPDFGMKITGCKLLEGKKIKCNLQNGAYVIEFSGKALTPLNTIVEIEVDGNALDIKPLEIPSQSPSFKRQVIASSESNPDWNGASSVNDGDWVGHSWMPARGDSQPWIGITLDRHEKISKAILYESGSSVSAFEIQYLKGEEWNTLYKGAGIGSRDEIEFPAVEAKKVRLLITGYSDIPSIYEMVLL
jgi:alpha-L-fucosidase